MKKSLFALFVFITYVLPLKSQDEMPVLPINENTNKIEYAGVVQVEGTAAELYTRCIAWINSFFPNASSVTRVRDSNNNVIEGLHRIRITNPIDTGSEVAAGQVQYEFKFLFRDGRYRYEINNFASREVSRVPLERWLDKTDSSHNVNTPAHLRQVDTYIKNLIDSKTKAMQPKVEIIEEW